MNQLCNRCGHNTADYIINQFQLCSRCDVLEDTPDLEDEWKPMQTTVKIDWEITDADIDALFDNSNDDF